ncbi:hypothetical protein BDC45DRAFT_173245 [Circinella umbellata]|nr:hypothetical protein BDC45DRAFT_173245 [Circinella umbellata]
MLNRHALFLSFLSFIHIIQASTCYHRAELIPLYYNKLFSQRIQIPQRYASQPFICPPYTDNDWSQKSRQSNWLVVDQDWRGDWLVKSDYKITALDNVDCNVLCTKVWTIEDAMVAKQLIMEDYQVEW